MRPIAAAGGRPAREHRPERGANANSSLSGAESPAPQAGSPAPPSRRRRLLFWGAVAAALLAVWQLWLFPVWTVRYRLTMDVATGDRIVSGSGVIETIWHDQWIRFPLAPGRPWGVDVRGEAVTVDLGSSGLLFLLLTPDEARDSNSYPISSASPASFLLAAFTNSRITGPGAASDRLLFEIERRSDVVEAPPALLPMLVRFRDIDDPKSIERVDPGDLAKVFGPYVKLVRVTARVVPTGVWPLNQTGWATPQRMFGAPVTTGIERKLPWVESISGYISGRQIRDNANPEQNITAAAFMTGLNR